MTADRPAARTPRLLRTALLVPAVAGALFAGPSLIPSDAPVPSIIKADTASAAPSHCIKVARNTLAVTRGNFPAAIAALRATGGCGDTLSDGICSASRQWWGSWARATVRAVTGGQYSRC